MRRRKSEQLRDVSVRRRRLQQAAPGRIATAPALPPPQPRVVDSVTLEEGAHGRFAAVDARCQLLRKVERQLLQILPRWREPMCIENAAFTSRDVEIHLSSLCIRCGSIQSVAWTARTIIPLCG